MPKSSTQNLSNKKINFSSDKKDDPVLSDDQMEEFLYENGNPIFNNNKETSDTLETDAFQEE